MKIRIAQCNKNFWALNNEFYFLIQTNDFLSCSAWGNRKYRQSMEQLVGGLRATHGIIYEGTYEQ